MRGPKFLFVDFFYFQSNFRQLKALVNIYPERNRPPRKDIKFVFVFLLYFYSSQGQIQKINVFFCHIQYFVLEFSLYLIYFNRELYIYDTFSVEETQNSESSPSCIFRYRNMTELPGKLSLGFTYDKVSLQVLYSFL